MWSSLANVLGFLWSSGGITSTFLVVYPPGGDLCLTSSSYCESGNSGLLLLDDEACASAAEARIHQLELDMREGVFPSDGSFTRMDSRDAA